MDSQRDIAETGTAETDIAIVGMAAHLPGAADIAAYWENLREGRRAIRRFQRDQGITVTGFVTQETMVRLLAVRR